MRLSACLIAGITRVDVGDVPSGSVLVAERSLPEGESAFVAFAIVLVAPAIFALLPTAKAEVGGTAPEPQPSGV
jgi:hypothetical protein